MRTTRKLRFWTDQVCINQEDLEEKEQQVKLMSAIFRQARLVVGWLGLSSPQTDLAFKTFHFLAMLCIEEQSKSPRKFRNTFRYLTNTGYVKSLDDIFDPSKTVWKALIYLTQLDWFRRLWIV